MRVGEAGAFVVMCCRLCYIIATNIYVGKYVVCALFLDTSHLASQVFDVDEEQKLKPNDSLGSYSISTLTLYRERPNFEAELSQGGSIFIKTIWLNHDEAEHLKPAE